MKKEAIYVILGIEKRVIEMERLQKVIAMSGVASRRKAEELIQKGHVMVDGKIVKELGTKVLENQEIKVNGILLKKEDKVYYLLNKPRGVVTTTKDDKNRKTVVDLIDTKERIYPVGRLDYDTTGVLILTNDGILANGLMHPSQKIEKVYIAKIEGIAKGEHLVPLKEGVILDGVKCVPSHVKLRKVDKEKNTSIVEITIHEGKNHEVKRMFESVGLHVLKLKRERVAFLNLEGLASGEYRHLTPKEVSKLYALIKNK